MSALAHVSASQIKDFKACNRLWYYTRILKQRAPQTEAQSRGTTVHGALEAHLKGGVIEPEILERAKQLGITQQDLSEYIIAMTPFVGKPGEGLTEFRDSMPTFDGGPNYVLVVDHAREIVIDNPGDGTPWGVIPQIDDLKTTSDFRYCKTPDELAHDVQMISYAKWALLRLYVEKNKPLPNFVSLRHVYVRTRGKRIATARDVLITPADVEIRWNEILVDVRDMVALAEMGAVLNPQDIPATTTDHCSAYGGCFFRAQCFGAVYDTSRPFMGLFSKEKKEIAAMADTNGVPVTAHMSLKDRVAARKAAAEAAARGEAPVTATATASTAAPATASAVIADPNVTHPTMKTFVDDLVVCGALAVLFPGCPCTLVPHDGMHESTGLTGGKVHWNDGESVIGLGASPDWKPKTLVLATETVAAATTAPTPQTAESLLAAFGVPSATVTSPASATVASPASATVAAVLPPDAASRTSTPEEVAAAGASKTARKPRATKAEMEARAGGAVAGVATTPAPAPVPAPAAAPAPATNVAAGVAVACLLEDLYIDAWPVKGAVGSPGLGEDILHGLSADAARAANMPDWRLVEYGKGKGAMAALLRERLGTIPKILVVTSSTPGSDVLIEVLSPHAKRIVRALRG